MKREEMVALFREAVRLRVERTSGRQVAAELGCSPGATRNFINGRTAAPHGKMLARLHRWYLQRAVSGEVPLSPDGLRYVVDHLLAAVPADRRSDAANELFAAVRAIYRSRGLDPRWLADLRGAEGPASGAAES